MAKTVLIPTFFASGVVSAFTGQIVGLNGYPTDNEFTFDFSYLNFIDGAGLTVLSNTIEWLHHSGVKIIFTGYNRPHVGSITYLDDCGFFQRHLGRSVRSFASVRSTTLPFTKVEHTEAFSWLEHQFTPFMCSVLGVRSGALASIRSCVGEIFNNINDHSTLSLGFAHVQHYPKKQTVCVTVSDFGRGIPNSMRQRRPELTDEQAILVATEEGVTSQTTPRNRGLGLDLLIHRVTGNGGVVTINSFHGSLACYRKGDGSIGKTSLRAAGAYPGTLVDITLPTAQFVGDEYEEEEIEW